MADRINKANRGALVDRAVATFAAGSVGFALCTLPVRLAGAAVVGTQAGRFLFALLAAVATYLGVSLLLAALGSRPRVRVGAGGLLRLRRADMHPDAPVRTPILAASELGAPLDELAIDMATAEAIDLEAAEDVDYDAVRGQQLPAFLEAETQAPAETETETEAVAVQPEERSEPSRPNLPFWLPEEETEDAASEATAEAESVVPLRISDEDGSDAAQEDDVSHASGVEGLMQRLEDGLVRRGDGRADPDESAPTPEAEHELEERLRGATSNLRKMAPR